MTKLGYPILPVIERAEFRLLDGVSRAQRVSHAAGALGILIVLCIAFPIGFLGITAFSPGISATKHARGAIASVSPSVAPGGVARPNDHVSTGIFDETPVDLVAASSSSSTSTNAKVAQLATAPETALQPDKTSSAQSTNGEASNSQTEIGRAHSQRKHPGRSISKEGSRSGREKHKRGIVQRRREMQIAADEATNAK